MAFEGEACLAHTSQSEADTPERLADPYRDLDVIDSRAPRFNQAVVGTARAVAVLTGWWWLLALLARSSSSG